jgi:hypothetical protein
MESGSAIGHARRLRRKAANGKHAGSGLGNVMASSPFALSIIFYFYFVLPFRMIYGLSLCRFLVLYALLFERTTNCPAMDSPISQRTSSPCSKHNIFILSPLISRI